MSPGVHKLTNEEYHASEGLSKSMLTAFDSDPASLEWQKTCPVDDDKMTTLDFGSAFHTSILEPELFLDQYAIAPNEPKNTKVGKAAHKAFNDEHGHKVILTYQEGRKLDYMRHSCLSHPIIKQLFDNKVDVEKSIFAKDKDDLSMKCRIDLESKINDRVIISDLKTIDKLDSIEKNIHLFKYHVQDAHYSEVYKMHYGKYPDAFLFIFISKTIELGRYPVRVVELDSETKDIGRALWFDSVLRYKGCLRNGFPGVAKVGLPGWAK